MSNFPFRLPRKLPLLIIIAAFCSFLLANIPPAFAADASASSAAPVAKWEWCGWGGGGYFWSCAADPKNPNTIYLGGDVNGVCKSTDQGKTWRFINKGLTDYEINSLVIDPHNTSIVYAFTATGICKSNDGGESWRQLPMTGRSELKITSKRGTTVRAIAVDAQGSNRIYAGSNLGQIFRSDDGGENWRELTLPAAKEEKSLSGKYCLLLPMKSAAGSWDKFGRVEKVYGKKAQDWSKFNKLTAALYAPKNAPKMEAQLVIQSGAGWLWQQGEFSELKADDWTVVGLDLSKLKDIQDVKAVYVIIRSTVSGFTGELKLDAMTLEPAAGGEKKIVADWENPGNADGWKAHKKDAKFRLITGAANSSLPGMSAIVSIAADPKTPGKIYVATVSNGVLSSSDAGESWQPVTELPKSGRSVAIAASNPRTLYAAMGSAGLFKSEDGGASWNKTNLELSGKAIALEVAVSRKNSEKVFCIVRQEWNGYLSSSSDGGKTWTVQKKYLPDFVANPTLPKDRGALSSVTNLAVCDPDGEVVFIAANWANVISTDGGKTLLESAAGADISCVHDLRFHNGKVYASAMDEGLLMSEDHGKNWKQLSPLKYNPQLSGHCWRVSVSGDEGKEWIVATISPWNSGLPNKVIVSSDAGKSFQTVTAGLPDYRSWANCMWGMSYARALAADPNNPQTLYLGMDGDQEKGKSGGGIFKSQDGGLSWQQLPVQPSSRRMFYGLAVDPTDSNRIYWGACSRNGGVHMSEDGGASWKKVFENDLWIFNLLVTADGTVYAAGKNLWRTNDHGKSWKQITKLPDNGRSIVGLEYDPQNPNTLWISTASWNSRAEGGVFKTTDGGVTWKEMTNLQGYVKPLILRFNPQTRELWAGGVGIFKIKQ